MKPAGWVIKMIVYMPLENNEIHTWYSYTIGWVDAVTLAEYDMPL